MYGVRRIAYMEEKSWGIAQEGWHRFEFAFSWLFYLHWLSVTEIGDDIANNRFYLMTEIERFWPFLLCIFTQNLAPTGDMLNHKFLCRTQCIFGEHMIQNSSLSRMHIIVRGSSGTNFVDISSKNLVEGLFRYVSLCVVYRVMVSWRVGKEAIRAKAERWT